MICNTEEVTLGVVVANQGYPDASTKSVVLPELQDLNCYYAGVIRKDGQLLSKGGRIYMVTETGKEIKVFKNHFTRN